MSFLLQYDILEFNLFILAYYIFWNSVLQFFGNSVLFFARPGR